MIGRRTITAAVFALALACGFSASGCIFFANCPDGSGDDYTLQDGRFTGRGFSGSTLVGEYPADGDIQVEVDADEGLVIVSFQSGGQPVELLYDAVEVVPPG